MITRNKRRRYIVLCMALAILTAFGSMWFSLEPAASEESRFVELLDESLLEESFVRGEDTEIEIHVLTAEPEFVYSTCKGEMPAQDCQELLVDEQQLQQAMSQLAALQKEGRSRKTSERYAEAELLNVQEEEEEEEESWYEEESYDQEPVYEEPVYEEPTYEEPSYQEPVYEEPASAPTEEQEAASAESAPAEPVYYSDLDYLAAICQIEAGYNYEGCLAVANAVLNRLNAGYASSIYGVIYAPYQFATDDMDFYLKNGTSEIARQAAQDALNGSNNVGSYRNFNGIYWLDPETLDCPYVVIGGNVFY